MKLHFGKATNVYLKTLPFVALRLGIGVAIGLLAMVYFGVIAFVLFYLMDGISGFIALAGLVLALLLFAGLLRLLKRYILYLVSAAHIAVIAETVETGEVPSNQLRYGKDTVSDRFAEASALFAVDQLVKGVIKQFNSAVTSFSGLVDFVPSLGQIIEILRKGIALAASYIDEAILAHLFVSEEENNWTAARDGVVLYAKCWKPVLTATILIVLGMYVLSFVGLLALTPVAAILSGLSPTFEILGWVIAGGIGLTVYLGVVRPWVKTVVITTFLIEARDETPDSDTADWIMDKSERFKELMTKADEGSSPPVESPDSSSGRDETGGTPAATE